MKRLSGLTALVTGGSTGIGRIIAAQLAGEGAKVVITGRNEVGLKESAQQHENISWVVADISSTKDVTRTIATVIERHGQLDILVNNAGVAPVTPLSDLQMDEYDYTFQVNVRGLIDTTLQALPFLKARQGVVINISSTVAVRPLPNMSIYSASKAAVSALTKSWGKELAKEGVRVNSLLVGPIETPIYEKTQLSHEDALAHIEAVKKIIPLGRFGKPEEVAAFVLFLASDESQFLTASEFAIDGGAAA